jgi:hypothetical protein
MSHKEIGHNILDSIYLASVESFEHGTEFFGSVKAGYFLTS